MGSEGLREALVNFDDSPKGLCDNLAFQISNTASIASSYHIKPIFCKNGTSQSILYEYQTTTM